MINSQLHFGFSKKNKYLPAPTENVAFSITDNTAIPYTMTPYKTIASFDLDIQKPKYQGAVPDATIKFYPLD